MKELTPNRNGDRVHRKRLPRTEVAPIFILGLPRTGTTFLYEAMTRIFPLAYVSAYSIFHYRNLLAHHADRTTGHHQSSLDAYFKGAGLKNRGIDGIQVSPHVPEEYGWILNRYRSSFKVSRWTENLFVELCRKEMFLRPEAKGLLLKNPYDTPHASALLERFPRSKVILITRDPVETLNSQFNAFVVLSSTRNAYLELLYGTHVYERNFLRTIRAVYRNVNPTKFRKTLASLSSKHFVGQCRAVAKVEKAIAGHPRALTTTYDELTSDPAAALTRIGGFLGLTAGETLSAVRSERRGSRIAPEIERLRPWLLERIEVARA